MDRFQVREAETIIALLQGREGGEAIVETPAGAIDPLTDEEVIEVKHVSEWKEGLKVLAYQHYFPNRKPRIHLFGGYSQATRATVEEVLSKLNVRVTWEREPF